MKTSKWSCVCRTAAISKNCDEDPDYAEVDFDRTIPSSVCKTFKS